MKHKTILFFIFILLLSLHVHADTVFLKNGRIMEGIIEEENAEKVVIDLGFGTISLQKDSIKDIKKTDDKADQAIRERWKSEYFDNERFAPEHLKGVVAKLNSLESKRENAVKAVRSLESFRAKEKELQNKMEEARAEYVESSRNLSQVKPAEDPIKYNQLVYDMNKSRADIIVFNDEKDKCQDKIKEGSAFISDYAVELGDFSSFFYQEKKKSLKASQDKADKVFFLNVEKRLQSMSLEFDKTEVACSSKVDDHLILDVRINGRLTGRLLLDTGSSTVTLSEDLAKKLGLDLASVDPVEAVLADGSKVMAKPVVLQSVEVGSARAENVRAVVLPHQPGAGVDGLLGMTYLRNFLIQIDSSSRKLIISTFNPN